MSPPKWAAWLLGLLAPSSRKDEAVGDLAEAHRRRLEQRGWLIAHALTALETVDVGSALLRARASSIAFSWLDVKLGARMLVKYPGLTFLGGLSIAFAIFIGASTFELISKAVSPTIPLPEGDRIVALRLWNPTQGRLESRVLYDVAIWREELRTVEDLAVYRDRERNLIGADGLGAPVVVAEVSASAFDLARTPPFLGRVLTEADERPGATSVVVIGHDIWTGRFGGDPDIVGTDVRLGSTPTTVVGVMPEGFGFPVAHDLWMPFGSDFGAYEPLAGPRVGVLGRLAPAASLADARSELAVLSRRLRTTSPATHEHLQPQVVPLAQAFLGLPPGMSWGLLSAIGLTSNLPLILFLILVCGNVALLLFARATSRKSELVVRSALGASRRRIVIQLFVEALVLATGAAVVALMATRYGLRWALWIVQSEMFDGEPLPFWIDASLSLQTVAYTGLLTVFAALVAGAWPGLRVTRSLGDGLKRGAPGAGGFRFGGVWTVVIASQIVVTMLFPVVTMAVRSEGSVELDYDAPFRAEQYMVARVRADEPGTSIGAGLSATTTGSVAARVRERLLAEPGVAAVTLAERLPMTYHPWHQIEIDGPSARPRDERGHRVGSARVTPDFFDVLDADIVAGRGFRSGDLEEDARAVIVDDAFVDRVLGGRNAVGVEIRYLANESYRDPSQDPQPWLQIVGVVEELGARSFYGPGGVYHPVRPDALSSAHLIVHLPSGAAGFASRVRAVATAVDPTLRLHEVQSLVQATREPRDFYAFWTTILLAVCGFALLLSLGGIYAVMSYTVAQRTREIGIRVALGSSRARVVWAVFRRPLRQVALGLVSGFVLLAVMVTALSEGIALVRFGAVLIGYCLLMTAICLAACATPTLRALRIEPGEALRVDG